MSERLGHRMRQRRRSWERPKVRRSRLWSSTLLSFAIAAAGVLPLSARAADPSGAGAGDPIRNQPVVRVGHQIISKIRPTFRPSRLAQIVDPHRHPGAVREPAPATSGPAIEQPSVSGPAPLTVYTNLYITSLTGVTHGEPGARTCDHASCIWNYQDAGNITLTADSVPGSVFLGWDGDCTGIDPCVVDMSITRSVTAYFGESVPPIASVVGSSPDLRSQGFNGSRDDAFRCRVRPCFQPANSWLAVGPSNVVQASDDGIRFTDRSGNLQANVFTWDFFLEPTSSVASINPRVFYDAAHGRWFGSESSNECEAGVLRFAVSDGGNPLAGWTIYSVNLGTYLPDRPTFGFSGDKIVLAYNVLNLYKAFCATSQPPQRSELRVFDMASVLAGVSSPASVLFNSLGDSVDWQPTRPVGAGNDIWVVGAASASPYPPNDVVVGRILGTVGGAIRLRNLDDTAPGFVDLSTAGGASRLLLGDSDLSDTSRITDAVAYGGAFWFIAENACRTVLSTYIGCVRVSKVDSTGLAQEFALGAAGKQTFGGAIGLSSDGTLFIGYAQAAAGNGRDISSFVTTQRTTDPVNSVRPSALIQRSTENYAGFVWGTSATLATDPVGSTSVWQAAMEPDGTGWSTLVSRLTHNLPAAPSGSIVIDGGSSSTSEIRVDLNLAPDATSGATEALVSNSPTLSGGLLADARRVPLGAIKGWPLTDPATGGSDATGLRQVYVQFGNGAGTWSSVGIASISFSALPTARYAGPNRYATAAETSARTFAPGVEVVYLANGSSFPDPLVSAAAAGWRRGPLLLTGATSLPAATAAELLRLKPRYVIAVGGPTLISNAVLNTVAGYTLSGRAFRTYGADRYTTAALIAIQNFEAYGPVAYVAFGGNFPDALAAAAAGGMTGAPVLLTATNSIPSATIAALQILHPTTVVVVGGTGVVSTAVANALKAYTTSNSVSRLSGPDRYATAAAISAATFAPGVEIAYVAFGGNFPDALAGAAAGGYRGGPVLLTPFTALPAATITELQRLQPRRIVLLGGTGVVSDSVLAELATYATGP